MQKSVGIRPLSESREFKVLMRQIEEARKDPGFVKAVKEFIRFHTK